MLIPARIPPKHNSAIALARKEVPFKHGPLGVFTLGAGLLNVKAEWFYKLTGAKCDAVLRIKLKKRVVYDFIRRARRCWMKVHLKSCVYFWRDPTGPSNLNARQLKILIVFARIGAT